LRKLETCRMLVAMSDIRAKVEAVRTLIQRRAVAPSCAACADSGATCADCAHPPELCGCPCGPATIPCGCREMSAAASGG
jgi:hypothetical protein